MEAGMKGKLGTIPFLEKFRTRVVPPLVLPLSLLFLAFMLSSCLSTRVIHQGGETDQRSGVLIRVFQNSDSAKAGIANAPGTLTELYRLDGRKETFLQKSLATEWGIDDLEPGKYRLRIPAIIDNNGNIRETRSGDRTTDFVVKRGNTTVVKVILKETPTGLIIAATVTVVFIVVAIALLMGEHDIKPPLPPPIPDLRPPHFPLPTPVVVAHELYIVSSVTHTAPRKQIPQPRVTSVLPGPGTVVFGGIIVPTLTLSQPIDELRLRPDTIKMLGSKSGIVRGTTIYENGLLRFVPESSLMPGESVTVTVYAGGVVNPKGRRLTKDFSWVFMVAP